MEHKEYGHGQFSRLLAVVMLAAAQSRAAENANTAQRIVVSIRDRN
ncbi:MAG: hypothetical protein QM757_28175 [Paludibaculum sp.]